jgi:hypothetical protein
MTQNDIVAQRNNGPRESHIRATAPALRGGITMVSPRAHFRISSEAFASLSQRSAESRS